MTENNIDWDLFSFVNNGPRKIAVIKALHSDLPKTPTQIRKEVKCWSSISTKILKQLEDKGLVKCLNPEARTGKLFILTEAGKKVQPMFFKEDSVIKK